MWDMYWFCIQGVNMLLYLWLYSHLPFFLYLWLICICVWSIYLNTLSYYTYYSRILQVCWHISSKIQVFSSSAKYLSALPANFSLFDLSSPLSSFCYSCLASSLVLTVFFGSRRICHCEGDDESPLITPCHCTGSLRFVHQACLQQWIKSSDTRCCELCKYEFIMETKLKPLRKVKHSLNGYIFVWSGT